jgi:hypothetical protein
MPNGSEEGIEGLHWSFLGRSLGVADGLSWLCGRKLEPQMDE